MFFEGNARVIINGLTPLTVKIIVSLCGGLVDLTKVLNSPKLFCT